MKIEIEIFDGARKRDGVTCTKDCLGRIANWIERRQHLIHVISVVPTGYDPEAELFDQYTVIYAIDETKQ